MSALFTSLFFHHQIQMVATHTQSKTGNNETGYTRTRKNNLQTYLHINKAISHHKSAGRSAIIFTFYLKTNQYDSE